MSIDNWYTSLEAIQHLNKAPLKMHVVGTVKTNQAWLPKKCIFPKVGRSKKARGAIKSVCNNKTGSKIYFTAWMDSKPVHLLHTFAPKIQKVKQKSIIDGTYKDIKIPRPTPIEVYNKGMGGTDKFDQFSSYYDDRTRVIFWQSRIFNHFLRASAINAQILYNKKMKKHLTLLQYLTEIIKEWCVNDQEEGELDQDNGLSNKKGKKPKSFWNKNLYFRISGQHFPEYIKAEKLCIKGEIKQNDPRRC